MAKKRKEICPYCSKSFAYLSRHKCKIKERVEGTVEDTKTVLERRIERIEEKKKDLKRNLRKDEKEILNVINKKGDIVFEELIELIDKKRSDLERILEVLSLQSKIKIDRELLNASWTKRIRAIVDYDDEVDVGDAKIDETQDNFIWELFGRIPCFICPFKNKCNSSNQDYFNPHHCPFLTDWINLSIEGKEFVINFDEIAQVLRKES